MGHALAVRSHTQLAVQMNPFSNPYIIAAVGLTTILQLLLFMLLLYKTSSVLNGLVAGIINLFWI